MGSIGNVAIVPEELITATANRAVGILRPRSGDSATSKYVCYLLMTEFGTKLLDLLKKGGIQQRINLSDLASLEIPIPDALTISNIVDSIESSLRDSSRKKSEASEILNSLFAWFLNALNVDINKISSQKYNRFFSLNSESLIDRMDVKYHSPYAAAIRKSFEESGCLLVSMRSIVSYARSGFAAGKQDQVDKDDNDGILQIRPNNIGVTGKFLTYSFKKVPESSIRESDICQKNEILFNNTNSELLVGKSIVFDASGVYVCSNHITRLGIADGYHPLYISIILNSLREVGYLGYLSTSFNNQSGINIETLMNMQIPVPPIDVQVKLCNEFTYRLGRAEKLMNEANSIESAAIMWLDSKIIG